MLWIYVMIHSINYALLGSIRVDSGIV